MKKIILAILLFPFIFYGQNVFQREITNQYNDVEVRSNNTVDFGSSDLELAGKDGTNLQDTYLRFEGITLPPDAVINNAYLVFYGDEASTTSTIIQISGEIGSSLAYPASAAASTGLNIKSRNYTSGFVEWITSGCVVNQQYQSPNLKNVLKEMFPNGMNGSDLAFRIKGNTQGAFTVKSFSAAAGQRPALVIDYWSLQGKTSAVVATANDDGREGITGTVALDRAYLHLGGRTDVKDHGIRFQNIQIPADAQITDAYIEFYTYSASPAGNMEIYSEIGNAAIYSITAKNITSRPYSGSKVSWQTAAWNTDITKYRTPNLKNIIDENRLSGWQSGSSMAFRFNGLETNSSSIVRSYEGGATYRPKLVIEYLNNGMGASIDGAITDPALMDKLYINEISSQGTAAQDEDWIELYNGSNDNFFIKEGVYISDKSSERTKHELKNIFVPARGYVILLADEQSDKGNNHLNFDLKNTGESIYLSRKVNGAIVQQDTVTFGDVPYNQSYGKLPDGTGSLTTFIAPTYKADNITGKQRLDLTFSKERGIYPSGFNLTISAPTGTNIKYTLDGKYPSPTTGTVYTSPITINKTSVVKAYAYDSAGNSSGIVAHTYVLQDNYANENTSGGYGQWIYKSNITAAEYAQAIAEIPVISVSVNAEPNTVWAEASMEYIDNNVYSGRKNFFSNSMTKKFGQESLGFYNPNLKLKFNADAGVKKANYPFFDAYPGDVFETPEKVQTIELKQGQDNASRNVYNIGFMRWSEKISMNLQKEMGKYALDTRYVNLFINGKYRGLKTMRNDFNPNNLEEIFGDDDDNYTKVNLQDGYFPIGIVETGDGSQQVWNDIVNVAASKNFQQFKNLVDVGDLIKFQIMFMFTDTENEAVAITHNTNRNVMKAKFMINDTDGSFFGGITYSSSDVSMPARGFAGGGGNYKYKWMLTSSMYGPGGLFGKFMGSNTNPSTGNLEFKTLVKDAVLKYIGPSSGNYAGAEGAVLSVARVQQKMTQAVNELDRIYKLDAAYMGYTQNVYQQWKTIDYPRILAQTPERVEFSLKKWKEYNMAHTLSAASIMANAIIGTSEDIQIVNPNSGTQLYYTLNGNDPMGSDGIVSMDAHVYNGAFNLPAGIYDIVTRAFTVNNWGPKSSQSIKVESPVAGKFVITGINYKPQSNGDAEFVLISNPGNADLDISGYTISDAFKYTFPQGTVIAQGQTIMLAKNPALINGFSSYAKYQWTSGSLANEGEPVTFKDGSGNTTDAVSYLPALPWPEQANGQGYYLKLISPELDNALPENWEAMSLSGSSARIFSNNKAEKEPSVREAISIYPNPVKDALFLNLPEKSEATVYTMQGQLIKHEQLKEGMNILNTSNWKAGIYLIKISYAGHEKTFKIMKK